jgi:hypothetical protein
VDTEEELVDETNIGKTPMLQPPTHLNYTFSLVDKLKHSFCQAELKSPHRTLAITLGYMKP